MDDRYCPFSCGSHAEDWMAANCDWCTKRIAERDEDVCPIERAILEAWFNDGTMSAEMAYRIGFLDPDGIRQVRYCWPCPEVDWTEEWKAKWIRRYLEEGRS